MSRAGGREAPPLERRRWSFGGGGGGPFFYRHALYEPSGPEAGRLAVIADRQRMLREFDEQQRSEEAQRQREREEGFEVYISGANADRIDSQKRRAILGGGRARSLSGTSVTAMTRRRPFPVVDRPRRRTWVRETVYLRTAGKERVRVRPRRERGGTPDNGCFYDLPDFLDYVNVAMAEPTQDPARPEEVEGGYVNDFEGDGEDGEVDVADTAQRLRQSLQPSEVDMLRQCVARTLIRETPATTTTTTTTTNTTTGGVRVQRDLSVFRHRSDVVCGADLRSVRGTYPPQLNNEEGFDMTNSDQPLALLTQRLQRMGRSKRQYILKVLDTLEREEGETNSPSVSTLATPSSVGSFDAPPKDRTVVCLRLLSSWGHKTQIGLTEVALFDTSGQKLPVLPSWIEARGITGGANVGRLVNGRTKTSSDRHMWLANVSLQSIFFPELIISVPAEWTLATLCLWNYNRSPVDAEKGVKDIEVLVNQTPIWQGTLDRAPGSPVFDYAVTVDLIHGTVERESALPACKPPSPIPDTTTTETTRPVEPDSVPQAPAQVPIQDDPPSTSTSSTGRPIWLDEDDVSERVAHSQTEDIFSNEVRFPSAGSRRSRSGHSFPPPPSSSSSSSFPSTVDSTMNFGTRRQKGRHPSTVSSTHFITPETTLVEENEENDTQKKPSDDFLDSLEFFQRTQAGRIERESSRASLPLSETEVPELRPATALHLPASVQGVDTSFEIPALPHGRHLTLDILSTWGDEHYVGLCGIEIFDDAGRPIEFPDVGKQIRACPSNINVLPEYNDDPRTVDKLVDGVNRTCDDMHVWLAPFSPGEHHRVFIDLEIPRTLSMIRVWNYNKSRIHSHRGARYVEMFLDEVRPIFKGEIQKAPGTLREAEAHAECILFTSDEDTLALLETNSSLPQGGDELDLDEEQQSSRPYTAGSGGGGAEEGIPPCSDGGRPFTAAVLRTNEKRQCGPYLLGQKLLLSFRSTWGDEFYLGLTGLEVLDETYTSISLDYTCLAACPRDLNDIEGHDGDDRTLDKLVDGVNVTTDDRHMWLIPFAVDGDHLLEIDLGTPTKITGLRFWNYNKSLEDTFRGAKGVFIYLDGHLLSPPEGHTLRKAPGCAAFDFGQFLPFLPSLESSVSEREMQAAIERVQTGPPTSHMIDQDYEPPLLPCGYIFKFVITSTWGDPHYVGLNGLELFDALGNRVPICPEQIVAVPAGVHVLEGMEGDIRIASNLVDGVNSTWNDAHMWLAPFTPGKPNLLFLLFSHPLAVSMIKVWNYAKTCTRGVEEMEINVDDVLVWRGFVRQAPLRASGPMRSNQTPHFAQTLLFTNDARVISKEQRRVYVHSKRDQEVQLINENRIIRSTKARNDSGGPANVRPSTSVVGRREPLP